MRFEKNIDSNTILVSSVSDGDAVVLGTLGYTRSSVNDREIDGRNGFKISCECWTKKEEKPVLGAFVLTTHYSFDSDMPVWMFATEEDARAELKRQFKEELRIQTEENEHVQGEDLKTAYTDEWDFASISIDFENTKDVMEWKVSQVRTDKGIGSEIPVPTKDDFMNPPVPNENEVTRQIVELLDHNELSAGNISEVFRALHRQDSCIGGKIWSSNDIRSRVRENYQVDLSDDAASVIADNINDTLDDYHDAEWMAINEALRLSDIKIKVTDINWDVDANDFDAEAEYNAVNENLPKEVEIPLSELEGNVEIEDYLSDNYDYCVKSFKTEEVTA